jgi:DNA-binding NtrC family response regulator
MFERVGDHKPINVDVRIICATNRNLSQLVAEGKFREDLFYRINVIPIHIPPLRQRKEEIPLLTRHFISKLGQKTGKHITGISPDVMARFMHYDWPGNIRELKSVLEYAFVVAEPETIHVQHLPEHFGKADQTPVADPISKQRSPVMAPAPDSPPPADYEASDSERQELVEALRKTGGNKSQAAKLLGVHRMTVWNRMKKYGIALEKEIRKTHDLA